MLSCASANAQQVVVDADETLLPAGNPYSGIQVTNGATLEGNGLVIDQSTNNYGLLVTNGDATLTGGSITQAGIGKYVIGVGVVEGAAHVNGLSISIDGAKDAGALYANGANAVITGDNLDIHLTAIGSTSAEPAAGIKVRAGTVSTSSSSIAVQGTSVFGLLASGNNGNQSVVFSQGDAISTSGERGWGAFAFSDANALSSGSIGINGGSITTNGLNSYGLLAQGANASIVTSDGLAITTNGASALGAYASGGSIDLRDTSVETFGASAYGARVNGGRIGIIDTNVTTHGERGYGVYATDGAINLVGGSVRTLNEKGRFLQDGDGARAYALHASGAGASITANGTTIETLGQRAYGVHAIDGAAIGLDDLAISTAGFMAYGIYASGAGSVITANNVDVTTTGLVGDAGWAYLGGRLELNGGTYHVQGEANPGSGGETANGFLALGGTAGTNDGVINARGVTVLTEGADSTGVVAGASVGTAGTSGQIFLTDSNVTARGANAEAGRVSYGSALSARNSTLVSTQGIGIYLYDNATVTLDATRVSAGQETFFSNLSSAGQSQRIIVGGASVATENNGTLLKVIRSAAGADGVVDIVLGNGSVTRGDILDEDARTTGGTDVTLEEEASWTGLLRGVRHFFGNTGGETSFEGEADIQGDLTGNGTSFIFSDQGGQIGGSVNLNNGSRTTGGTVESRINVAGDVAIDDRSVFGGNWNIAGDLANAGTLTPGNSIGRVSIAGDLLLAPTSIYEVEIDATGDADLVEVGGTATLDGAVTVTPLGGFLVGSPYTILTAGDLVGSFDSVSFSQASAFIDASLSYDPNAVLLTITRNGVGFASVATTGNQAAVAGAIDQLPLTNALATAMAFSTVEGAAEAFDQLSGEIHASASAALIEDSRHLRDAATARIRSAFGSVDASNARVLSYGRDGPVLVPAAGDGGVASWSEAFGSWGKSDGDGNAASIDRSTGGLLVGADGLIDDTWRIGLMAGYGRSSFHVDGRASSASSDNIHLGLYGGTQWGALGLRSGLAYTWSDIESSRSISFPGFADGASADYDAGAFQAFGELGYAINSGTTSFEPFANVAHVRLKTDGFTEQLGAASLTSQSERANTTFTTVGARAATMFNAGRLDVTASGMVGWRHAFGDTDPTRTQSFAGSSPFTAAGIPLAENLAVLEAGLGAGLSERLTAGVFYTGQLGNGVSDQGFRANLSWRF